MNTIAAIQMCSSHLVDENLETAAALIKEAAQNGAVMAVLPENFVLIDSDERAKLRIKETAGSGKIQNFLAQLARLYKIWIVAGTIPLACDNPNKVRAACLVYDDQGRQVARFDKIHLFDVSLSASQIYKESNSIEAGKDPCLLKTPFGKLALCVCFDLRFPDLFSQFVAEGAEIIAVPAAFTQITGKAHWKLLCRSRAIDTQSYVIGSCQGGTHSKGRKTYGHSLIVDPWGQVVDEVKKPGPGIAYASIDLEKLHRIRNTLPVLKGSV